MTEPQEGWDGHVGFVPNYVKELAPSTNKTVLVCGPPIMIKFTLAGLKEIGFTETQVYTTMELRMKCAVGKCGRCNIGNKYVCKDESVFSALTSSASCPMNIKEEIKSMANLVNVYLFGKKYEVPEGLTIMTAMEYARL